MKKIILSALVVVLGGTTLLMNGCKKDDTTAPVVKLNGSSSQTVSLNGSFSDPGATATDDKDGSITPTVSGTVAEEKETVEDNTIASTENLPDLQNKTK